MRALLLRRRAGLSQPELAKKANMSVTTLNRVENGHQSLYMEKIAAGPEARGVIDLDAPVKDNLRNIARAKGCEIEDLTVVILDRPRHENLIAQVRQAGARIWMIGDGDVQAAIAASMPGTGVDVLMGIGGAPEGVIAAAALRCTGGDFQGRLHFSKPEQRRRAEAMGVKNPDQIFHIDQLAKGNVMFCATGVTDGALLKGVQFRGGGATTHSLVMRSATGTIRFVEAIHNFSRKPL
jgi:fructose-1,6-bisphosphatase class II